ncbi:hypothetical protein HUE87_03900 [Candidatus Sulfurimonas marisnigri]|uniref:DUF4878 domain-containing protein n=1 Tax=Candidatus Sulfurimonas marisnigri TaxID=2740405 RepID=A0A7S7M1K7_9BACT|nr:hypothetical protein [Candidatus Sulfurimonas marisnigri]QOY55389.1 hypothetical protein HUE87_03900 [Candidatus Sulfurimonas marisnigri]
MNLLKTSLILPALLLIGCSGSPKDAVSNMYDALQDGNIVKLVNNTGESLNIMLISNSLKECSVNKKGYTDNLKLTHDCLVEKYADLSYKDIDITLLSEDKGYAKVTVIANSKERTITLLVQKIDDTWIVQGLKSLDDII